MICLVPVDLWWEETLHGNIQRKTAQFIWLYSHRLSLSWEIGICIFCFQCQHRLPGTAALLGRALWWVENQRSTEELLITADRQISFWRTTHGLSTLVEICLGREYFTVSLTLSRHVNKLFRLFWCTSTCVWFIAWELWGNLSLEIGAENLFSVFQHLLDYRCIHSLFSTAWSFQFLREWEREREWTWCECCNVVWHSDIVIKWLLIKVWADEGHNLRNRSPSKLMYWDY